MLIAPGYASLPPLDFIIYCIGIFPWISRAVQRLHDFNMSGWVILLPIIIMVASIGLSLITDKLDSYMFYLVFMTPYVFIILLLFPSGTRGRNKYG